MRPAQVSEPVFWLLIGGGGLSAVGGLIPRVGRRRRAKRRRRVMAGRECRRVLEALDALMLAQADRQPRLSLLSGGEARLEVWRRQTLQQYRNDLRPWALEVFDEAVRCGGASASSRTLVESPTPAQLMTVAGLFRDAAATLDRDS